MATITDTDPTGATAATVGATTVTISDTKPTGAAGTIGGTPDGL